VTEDIEDRFHFNTAISAVMELFNTVNQFISNGKEISELAFSVIKEAVDTMVILLHPVVPHITEELWRALDHSDSLAIVSWPTYREEALKKETCLVVIQVNGKLRSRIEIPVSLTEKEIQDLALKDTRIQSFIQEKEIKKVIVVQKKLVNIVV
jgi:leucyl-tRNA synthetase